MAEPTDVQFERDVGGGEQLPQGAASSANAAAAAIPPSPINDVPMPEIGDEGPDYQPKDEREELLFGPAEGKGRDFPAGPVQDKYVPSQVVRKLPALQRAAMRSDAPPALVALYRMTVRALEDEMRENG